ncbi:Fic family protein [Candidatus Contubernalis alkaliaceticus]
MSFDAIDKKRRQLDRIRPLPKNTLKALQKHMLLEWTYNSNAIEGSTLTLSETKVVLEGITVGGKTIREHLEVINHKAAILYIEELVQSGESLTEWNIKSLHRLVLKKIDDKNAGMYRLEYVVISGAEHRPPVPVLIKQQMEQLIEHYNNVWHKLHPVERAVLLHGEFVKIHPFIDGNGRTARLLMNFELIKSGFPPAVIKAEKKLEYYEALDLAHTTGKYSRFIKLLSQCVEQSLHLWLSVSS